MQPTYVVGSGGLLGSALIRNSEFFHPFPVHINWETTETVAATFNEWAQAVKKSKEVFSIAWAAGTARVGSADGELQSEFENFKAFLGALSLVADQVQIISILSSAGGIYGGSKDSPINEQSQPSPISGYGSSRIALEEIVTRFGQTHSIDIRICRISNVYGPGQNPKKQQGLITALVRSNISRKPLELFVPIDTRRDYIYVDDAARKIISFMQSTKSTQGEATMKIIASGSTISIGELIAEVNRVRGIRTPVVFAKRAETLLQPLAMSFVSNQFTDIDQIDSVPISVGVAQVVQEQIHRLMNPA